MILLRNAILFCCINILADISVDLPKALNDPKSVDLNALGGEMTSIHGRFFLNQYVSSHPKGNKHAPRLAAALRSNHQYDAAGLADGLASDE